MNTRKTVYNKLFKEETQLAKHEVELGLIQDVDKIVALGSGETKKATDLVFKAKGLLTETLSFEKGAIIKYNEALKKAEIINSQVKELGLPDNEIKDTINRINSYIKFVNEKIKTVEQALKSL
jgi:hypothetical protein